VPPVFEALGNTILIPIILRVLLMIVGVRASECAAVSAA